MNPTQPSQLHGGAALLNELQHRFADALTLNADLAALSRWQVGGRAPVLVRPTSIQQLANLVACLHRNQARYLVIGATSNLLFADAGLKVVAIQIGDNLAEITINAETGVVEAQAGTWVPGLARSLMLAGLSGLEHTCGIPGTLGGLICMNGGSQRQGIGSHVVSVTSITPAGAIVRRTAGECRFAYRESVFQENGEIIVSVKLRLSPPDEKPEAYTLDVNQASDQAMQLAGGTVSSEAKKAVNAAKRKEKSKAMRREMLHILRSRRLKFPQKQPNCGSVFKSNPAMYAEVGPPGAVIERLGFKGMRVGGAQVSEQHANFIVNTGGAKALDTLTLIARIQSAVLAQTGYTMVPEAGFVTPDGEVIDPVEAFQRFYAVNGSDSGFNKGETSRADV